MTVLDDAKNLVEGARAQEYGDIGESFTRIAGMWSAYLNHPIKPNDVSNMMILLKISRAAHGFHVDSYADIAGYALCAQKINER